MERKQGTIPGSGNSVSKCTVVRQPGVSEVRWLRDHAASGWGEAEDIPELICDPSKCEVVWVREAEWGHFSGLSHTLGLYSMALLLCAQGPQPPAPRLVPS